MGSVQDQKAICKVCPVIAGIAWFVFLYINAIAFPMWIQLQLQSFQQKSKLSWSWRYDKVLGLITYLYIPTHKTIYSYADKLKLSPRKKFVTQDRTPRKGPSRNKENSLQNCLRKHNQRWKMVLLQSPLPEVGGEQERSSQSTHR